MQLFLFEFFFECDKAMSASAQRPCVLQQVIAVQGGGIDPSVADCSNAWIFKPTIVDGKQFVDIYIGNYHCKQFLGTSFKMVDHIKSLRNKMVYELMQKLSKEEDPNEENAQCDGPLTMPKRELFDRLPAILTIDVKTTSMVSSVNVLPSSRNQGVLQIELTQPNLDLLLEEPAVSAPWTPTIKHENVTWIAGRNMVRCIWWDSKKFKNKTRPMSAEFSSDMDNDSKDAAVLSAAEKLQEFYDTHHNLQKNMPGESDDGGSAESAHCEPEESAESAQCGPVQKAAKTD